MCNRSASDGSSSAIPCLPSKNAGVPVMSRYRTGKCPSWISSTNCRSAFRAFARASERTLQVKRILDVEGYEVLHVEPALREQFGVGG